MDITSHNTFTAPVLIQGGKLFDVSIRGDFEATATLQRSRSGITDWKDVEAFTAPIEKTGEAGSAWFYRVGVKSGEYTSGIVSADVYG